MHAIEKVMMRLMTRSYLLEPFAFIPCDHRKIVGEDECEGWRVVLRNEEQNQHGVVNHGAWHITQIHSTNLPLLLFRLEPFSNIYGMNELKATTKRRKKERVKGTLELAAPFAPGEKEQKSARRPRKRTTDQQERVLEDISSSEDDEETKPGAVEIAGPARDLHNNEQESSQQPAESISVFVADTDTPAEMTEQASSHGTEVVHNHHSQNPKHCHWDPVQLFHGSLLRIRAGRFCMPVGLRLGARSSGEFFLVLLCSVWGRLDGAPLAPIYPPDMSPYPMGISLSIL